MKNGKTVRDEDLRPILETLTGLLEPRAGGWDLQVNTLLSTAGGDKVLEYLRDNHTRLNLSMRAPYKPKKPRRSADDVEPRGRKGDWGIV
jgi:hypothetical protein